MCLSVTTITKKITEKIVDGFVSNFIGRFPGGKGQILLPRYLMNSFDKTDKEYSVAPTDDLITF